MFVRLQSAGCTYRYWSIEGAVQKAFELEEDPDKVEISIDNGEHWFPVAELYPNEKTFPDLVDRWRKEWEIYWGVYRRPDYPR